MREEEAIEEYNKMSYDLSKIISKLSKIKNHAKYVSNAMEWDGMFEIDFSESIEKLGNVLAAMVCHANEEKYRKNEIEELKSSLEVIEK